MQGKRFSPFEENFFERKKESEKRKDSTTNRNFFAEKSRESGSREKSKMFSRIFREPRGRISSWLDCRREEKIGRRREKSKKERKERNRVVGERDEGGGMGRGWGEFSLVQSVAEKEKETRETLSPAGMNNSVRARIVGRAHVACTCASVRPRAPSAHIYIYIYT